MNKIIILLILNFNFLNASSIMWYGNYNKALFQAQQQNKDLFILLQKKNCSDCINMFTKTFNNKELIKILNRKYISVIINNNKKNSYPIELYYTLIYPSLFFIKYQDESFKYKSINGFISPKEIINILLNN